VTCICATPLGNEFFVEHERRCPLYEPPLTQAEIRQLREWLRFKPMGTVFARPFLTTQVDGPTGGGETSVERLPTGEKFVCPRSIAEGRPFDAEWELREGFRRCSYDGSMHPDDFMEYVKAGKTVGSTDKGYKFYASDDGYAKFYTHHLSHEQGLEFLELWQAGKVNFGEFPPYVPIYLPGPSTGSR
jgi:hypothetical protein